METKTVNIVKIFLASSSELHDDRVAFADFIERLQNHYESRNHSFLLKKWEYLDSAYNDRRKQDEYNNVIQECDLFVVIFHTKVGKYTLEEFEVALQECHKRKLPLFIYFKDTQGTTESEDISKLKNRIANELEHFWGTYDTNDKLHLNFLLWLDSFLYGGTSDLKLGNNEVFLGNVKVADMSQLSFVTNNAAYQQYNYRIKLLNEDIEQVRQNIQKYPKDNQFVEQLSKKEIERNNLLEEFERQKKDLIDTAKRIVELRREQISEKFRKAIDHFEKGHLDVANNLLDEIKQEGYVLANDIKNKHKQLHEHIEALRFQAKTVLQDVNIPINERISHITDIYDLADNWATISSYEKKKHAQLLFEYSMFLYNYNQINLAEEIGLRLVELSEEIFGIEDDFTSNSYIILAAIYILVGDYDKALDYLKLSLSINEAVWGDDHIFTALTYNNISSAYQHKGDYNNALAFSKKALKIYMGKKDIDNPTIAMIYNNLGTIYSGMNQNTQALVYHIKALDIMKKTAERDSPNLAIIYNTTGMTYYYLKKFKEAKKCLKKALSIREEIFGTYHSSTGSTYNNIGMVYHSMGDPVTALKYYSKAREIFERVLGNNHVLTAKSYNNIGSAHATLGAYLSALSFLNLALEIREKRLGSDHPDTLESRELIKSVERMMNK